MAPCKHLRRCGFAVGAASTAYLFLLILCFFLFLVPFISLETELESVSLGVKKPGRFKCVILPRSWQREHCYVYRSVGGSFSLSLHDRFQNDPPKCTLPLSATCDSSLCQLTESRGRIFPRPLSTQRLTKEAAGCSFT